MTTITIPKKVIQKDDLVIIPRREYEKLIHFWTNAEQLDGREKK